MKDRCKRCFSSEVTFSSQESFIRFCKKSREGSGWGFNTDLCWQYPECHMCETGKRVASGVKIRVLPVNIKVDPGLITSHRLSL
jgi:hypothetical protein